MTFKLNRHTKLTPYNTAILLCVLVAAFLRLCGINFGLPCLCRPDEELVRSQMTVLWYSGNSAEHFVFYPTLFAHLLNIIFLPWYMLEKLAGSSLKYGAFLALSDIAPKVHLFERLLSVTFGLLVIFPLYQLSRNLGGKYVSLVSIWIYAVAYLPVRDAHFGVTDQLAALATTFALWRCIVYNQNPTNRNALFAGLCVGWALASKYIVATIPIMFLAHFWRPAGSSGSPYFNKRLAILLCGCLFAVIILFPEIFTGWRGLSWIIENQKFVNRLYFKSLPIGWVYFTTFTLPLGIGIPCLVLAFTMFVRLFFSRDRSFLFPGVLFLLFFTYAGSVHGVYSRHLDPILPVLTWMAGLQISQIYRWLDGFRGRAFAAGAASLLLASCLLPNLIRDFGFLQVLTKEDTRLMAYHWLEQHIESGERIAYDSPYIGIENSRKFVPVVMGTSDLDKMSANNIQYVILGEYIDGMLPGDRKFCQQVRQRTDCHLVQVFSPYVSPRSKSTRAVEFQDMWFLPFSGFDGIERPGPKIEIYEVL